MQCDMVLKDVLVSSLKMYHGAVHDLVLMWFIRDVQCPLRNDGGKLKHLSFLYFGGKWIFFTSVFLPFLFLKQRKVFYG